MRPSTLRTALMIAAITAPLWGPPTWAVDAHHPPQGTVAQTQAAPQPAPTSAALSEPTIKALQEALSKQGIAVKADGVLSDETRVAIRTYQSQHHLPVTGEPDTATLDKLGVRQSAATVQPSTSAQSTTPPAGGPPAQAQAPSPPAPQAPTQPGQMPGGMMMNCPMMQGMMQGQMQGMMQMMQTMQGQMQAMMQMMQTMQRQTQPGQAQPGAK
jgi:Putative peptidoglycan binding domain